MLFTLTTRVDQDTFKLIKQLVASKSIKEKKFDEITKLMKDYYHPKPSIVMKRCKFYLVTQETNESITEFAEKLKKLSLRCDFKTYHSTVLHDQLVCGICDRDSKANFLKVSSLNFDIALKTALSRESALKNAEESSRTL